MKAEIRKLLGSDKLVIGSDRVLKMLRHGELKKVILASNCKQMMRDDIISYSKQSDVEIIELDVPNEELGVYCKKPFHISVLGIRA
jgi:large subunit ribosomal protein L30e